MLIFFFWIKNYLSLIEIWEEGWSIKKEEKKGEVIAMVVWGVLSKENLILCSLSNF